jgi:alpha-beta hydrolase superfamily lysophospholipase
MNDPQPLTTYLELRESNAAGEQGSGLSHKAGGLVLLHVLELAARGEPRGGITILHDAGAHGGRYLEVARALARERWAVALPDLRGHGRSEGVRGHSAGLIEVLRDIEEVQQHLAYRLPIAPKVLVGQGIGALFALAFALDRPGQLAGLVLCAPQWSPRFRFKPASGLFKAFKKAQPTDAGSLEWEASELLRDPGKQAAWKSDELVHGVITHNAAQQIEHVAREHAGRLSQVDCPVLILCGSADKLSDPSANRSKAGAKVEVREIPQARHELLNDAPSECIAELCAWLARAVAS